MGKLLKSNWNRIAVWALCMALTREVFGGTPTHGIPAANFKVVQNDTANSVDSVSVSTTLAINDVRVRPGSNRGDYNLQVGDTGTHDVSEGLVMVAVTQNGRDNGELENILGYAAPSFDSGAAGYWAVVQDVTSDRAEYNMKRLGRSGIGLPSAVFCCSIRRGGAVSERP